MSVLEVGKHQTAELPDSLKAAREGRFQLFVYNFWPKPIFFLYSSRASVSQQDNRNPRAKALWEKWRHVWMMAWERDRRLKEKLNYLQELEKVKNFDWDDWRKRFLKHHNNKKSRVTDLFRKLDEDADGKA